MLLSLLFTLFILIIYFVLFNPYQYWKRLNAPYLKPLPFFGNMVWFALRQKSFARLTQDIYHSCKSRYVGIYVLFQPRLFIKDLDLMKQIGVKDFDHFVDRSTLISEDNEPLFGKNLLGLKGDHWRHMRATLTPAFTGSKMRAMFVLMAACAENFANYYLDELEKQPNKTLIIELKEVITKFTTDVITSTAFGLECDSLRDPDNKFYKMGQEISHFNSVRTLKILANGINPGILKYIKLSFFTDELRQFFRNIVAYNKKLRAEQKIIRPDIMHLLLEAQNGKLKYENEQEKNEAFMNNPQIRKVHENFQPLSDDDLTAQVIIFFIGGFSTLSSELSHLAYELAINLDVQKRLQEEIDSVLKECNGKLTYDTVMKMKYMDMVIQESLRKWPAAPIMDRVCIKPYQIPSKFPGEPTVNLKVGDQVWFPYYAIHMDPQYFPDPEKFDPERFSDENKGKINSTSYVPFGIGPRSCVATRYGLMGMKTLIFYILAKFCLETCYKSQVPLQISKKTFNFTPEKGFWVGLKLRNNNCLINL